MESLQYEVVILIQKRKVSRDNITQSLDTISRYDKRYFDFGNADGLFNWLVGSVELYKGKDEKNERQKELFKNGKSEK